MDGGLRVGAFAALVDAALANARLLKLFQQVLDASHSVPLQQHLHGADAQLMPPASVEFMRQLVRRHRREPVHVRQDTLE